MNSADKLTAIVIVTGIVCFTAVMIALTIWGGQP